MDRLRALEVFIEIADAGSLAGAARSLSISAPSVTRVLGELESELGVLLFHRTTRALALTDPGRSFLESARRIVHDYQDASDAVRGAHRVPRGLLRLTAPILFGQHYVSPILMAFLDRYPEVRAETIYLDRVVNLVEEGFDVAVRIGPLSDSGLMAIRVGEVRRVVCGTPAYFDREGWPQTPSDLAHHRVIAARPLTPTDEWRFASGRTVKISPVLSFTSNQAAIETVKSGWALTRVLSYQVGRELTEGTLVTVLGEHELEPLPIHLVHPEGRSASAKVRAFVDMAAEILRNDPYLHR